MKPPQSYFGHELCPTPGSYFHAMHITAKRLYFFFLNKAIGLVIYFCVRVLTCTSLNHTKLRQGTEESLFRACFSSIGGIPDFSECVRRLRRLILAIIMLSNLHWSVFFMERKILGCSQLCFALSFTLEIFQLKNKTKQKFTSHNYCFYG